MAAHFDDDDDLWELAESYVDLFPQGVMRQYNCSTRIFFLYCSCIALVWTPVMQHCNTSFLKLAENLQGTCSSCKKLIL